VRKTDVVLADPHPFVRIGVRCILERDAGFRVVAEAEDGDAAVALTRRLSPGLVVLALRLPAANGIETTRRILTVRPKTAIVILSVDEDADVVSDALRSGARGYVSKQSAPEELLAAARAAVAGRVSVCARLTHRDAVSPRSRDVGRPRLPLLDERDRSILQLVAEGHSNRSIAARLHRSVKTIEAARSRLTRKLGVFSVAELTKFALRHGLTSIDT
jgi:two-component system NarL family response regulator